MSTKTNCTDTFHMLSLAKTDVTAELSKNLNKKFFACWRLTFIHFGAREFVSLVPVLSVWWAVKRWTLPPRSSAPRWRWRAARAHRNLVPAAGRGWAGWTPVAGTELAVRCSPSEGLRAEKKKPQTVNTRQPAHCGCSPQDGETTVSKQPDALWKKHTWVSHLHWH